MGGGRVPKYYGINVYKYFGVDIAETLQGDGPL
jgi:hypothetical protein